MYLTVIVCLTLFFPAVAIFSMIRQRKRKTAGQEICVHEVKKTSKQMLISKSFDITTNRKWCRIRLTFKRRDFGKPSTPDLHPYTLSVRDPAGPSLVSEERALAEFFGFCWSIGSKVDRKPTDQSYGDAVLLEFRPMGPGNYTVEFSLQALEDFSAIDELGLSVIEGVYPLRKKPYIHQVVDLKKKAAAESKAEKDTVE
ncbi:MAG: hypothetical protein GY868_08510 [Deltaproteobacteria bacterium]|nr:hypothetical protein [Deltaproteobacteria bacterium]